MTPLAAIAAFLFGTVIGSFLNAVLWRLRTGEGFVRGRSYCPCCRHQLAPQDLIPVMSYLLLRGKCRYCKAGIHPSYLLIELSTGTLFALFAAQAFAGGPLDGTGLAWLLLRWYFVAVLTIVFVYDLKYMLIPRNVTAWASVVATLAGIALGQRPFALAAGFLVGAGIFYLQYVASKGRWIGGGDIHLGGLMGLMLSWPLVLVALFIAYVSGACVGGALLLSKRTSWKGQIPFGTFLSAATVVTLLWGDKILAWYLRLAL